MDIFKTWLTNTPIAHRGLHNDELPENSLGAFKNAIEHGYPIELDVRELDDGTPVVFHDNTLSRMTGKDGYISNLKISDLTDFKLLNTEYSIPSLKEVLDLVNKKPLFLLRLKTQTRQGHWKKTCPKC